MKDSDELLWQEINHIAQVLEIAAHVLSPHLSLLYKTMPLAMLAGICQAFDVPKGPYVFDRLRAIETEIPLTGPDQIKRWRTVFECTIGQL
jgi:hypothetical protein